MIYKWVKIDIQQRSDITELGTFTMATPRNGCWLGIVKLFMTIEGFHSLSREVQLFFGDEAFTGIMYIPELKLDLDQYHEVLSGEVDEPLEIITGSRSVQGYALLSETEG